MISKFAKILDTTIVAATSSCILWLVKELLRFQVIRVQCNFTTFYSIHIKSSYLLVQKKNCKMLSKNLTAPFGSSPFSDSRPKYSPRPRLLASPSPCERGLGNNDILSLNTDKRKAIWRSMWYEGDTRHRWRFSVQTSPMYASLYCKAVFPLAKFLR